jgi:hypothetical protein
VEAWPGARDRALALLPLYADTRIAGIRALDVADVRLSARKGGLHLVGKGVKSWTVPVHAKLREVLAAWLAERPTHRGADPGRPVHLEPGHQDDHRRDRRRHRRDHQGRRAGRPRDQPRPAPHVRDRADLSGLDTGRVHATLALVAATALAGAGRAETGAWHAVAGIRLQDASVPR